MGLLYLPVLTYVLQVISCYCSYTWADQLVRGVFHLDISFSCWFFKILQPPLRECVPVSCFTYINISVFIGPVTGFPLESIAVNHLHATSTSGTKLGCCSVCCLKRPFRLSLDVINNHNWSFCFFLFHRQLVIRCCMKP
jgi:hypothetical protein